LRNALDNAGTKVILGPPSMNQLLRATLFQSFAPSYIQGPLLRALSGAFVIALASCALAADSATGAKSPDLADLSLEALMDIEVPKVYGASKFEQRTTEAPSSISLVTADEIKKYGHRTLADVLQSVQGLHVSYDRNYAFLGARGINLGDFNSRVLLLVNGHRVNNNLTDGAFIDSAFILDVDLIDRVEVIRGPGSVLYGNNAFFGVINVITRQGRQVNGAEVSGEYAEFDTYKGRVTIGKSFTNGIEFLFSGSLYDSEGPEKLFYREFNTPENNNGIARRRDDDSFGSFFGSVRYRDFTLEGGFISREKGNPTAQLDTAFNDPRFRTEDERSYVALKYAHNFPEIVDVTAQIYYDRSDFEVGYPQRFGAGTNVIRLFSKEKDVGEWWGAELQLNKRLWDRHIVSLGGEYRDDFRQEFSLQQVVRSERQSHGVYVQGDFALRDNLHLNTGVRYDQYGDFDETFNPRLAMIYHPVEKSTIKAIYGTAFRAPNFLELTLKAPTQELEPEEITSYELVYEQEIARHVRTSVSGFYNEMDGLIAFANGEFVNFDAEAKGVELAVEGSWTNIVRGRLSYTLQKTDSTGLGFELPDSPEHLVKLNVSVPLYKDKIFAGVEFQFTSERESLRSTSDSTGNPLTVQGSSAGGYGVVNFTLFSRELVKNLEFSASVYNLLDKKYSDPATRSHRQDKLERDGRTFRLKLTYRF
jgi:outer membrane receptor for ferrienterochelin and colicins